MFIQMPRAALYIAISSVFFVSGCDSTSSEVGPDFNNASTVNTPTNTSFDEQALIDNLTDNIITPVFEQFSTVSATQIQSMTDYCQVETSAEQGNSTAEQVTVARNSAQTAWNNTMDVWQQAELMQIGPLAENNSFLRNKIYSWPIVNTCSVDFEVLNFRAGNIGGVTFDITNRTPSRRGLYALEYLLFNEDLNHSCMTSSEPLIEWNNQTEAFRKVARCEFAVEVASDINNSATELLEEWTGETGFANLLKGAGDEGNPFSTELEAINRITDAFFYLDTFTKDGKLATPLGIFDNICGSQVCPEAVESLFANYSAENIENNLIAFQRLFSGETGTGFDDYLTDVGDGSTATSITTAVQTSIDTIQSYQSTLAETLIADEDLVTQTHADISAITDDLKADFINSLALELPATAAGDND